MLLCQLWQPKQLLCLFIRISLLLPTAITRQSPTRALTLTIMWRVMCLGQRLVFSKAEAISVTRMQQVIKRIMPEPS